ncbi:TonB-dependent receptor domain-containing protein [Pedobacter agri]|uniref:TonB-dependent receptor domain-containing protein n=1 Tax=Pedobacter agri TaxID=454586 RepID=UPI002783F445|nr:TonB-dependent receptor [Pedobacter agri]MDQ1142205.1 outer membrane receptor protein involved in Fe transport [Pedobacter agri]
MKNYQCILTLLCLFTFLTISNAYPQDKKISISGQVKDARNKLTLPYANIIIKKASDAKFSDGTISDEQGRFLMKDVNPGNYQLQISLVGYLPFQKDITIGTLSPFIDLGIVELIEAVQTLQTVNIEGSNNDGLSTKLDKKTFDLSKNTSQLGGSVLQAMQNLPGISIQDGKVQLRGNDKIAVLIDGKQNAITGFGSQTGLDNIPASAIEKIEIINNPSSKYDANGNAGIINIIYKRNKQEGFNGKIGLTSGLGAIWLRKQNLLGISPQYQATPKINPSLSLNYKKNKLNTFAQADYLYTQSLNKNEFSQRIYTDGTILNQQVKRNRTTTFTTIKSGVDYNPNERNSFLISGFFNREKIGDLGDIPYFNSDFSVRNRFWQFIEDEVKYTATGTASYQHKFAQPGHTLSAGFNYTWHRENEKYYFKNIMPTFTGEDAFKLLSDEHVADLNIDYVRPMKHGRIEGGLKYRNRFIPTDMQFFPGLNSPIDANAGGWADYSEQIPAVYGNYIYEDKNIELEAGLRLEYVKLDYQVNPNHNTYKSDGYEYFRPFPNLRFVYKINDKNRLSAFYSQRVDRPNEVDIRIFPKYDDPELLKVGNPTLRPQFTHLLDLGYKNNWKSGYFYLSGFHKIVNGTITRIATIVPGNNIIYNIFQNAGRSYNTGGEVLIQQQIAPWVSMNVSGIIYQNTLNAFSIQNQYPVPTIYNMPKESILSGNLKWNVQLKLVKKTDLQLSATYLAPDLIPQGRIGSRFSTDLGIKRQIQNGKGEFFLNGNDIFNTLKIRKDITGNGFRLISTDYNETQVFRIGYSYKF